MTVVRRRRSTLSWRGVRMRDRRRLGLPRTGCEKVVQEADGADPDGAEQDDAPSNSAERFECPRIAHLQIVHGDSRLGSANPFHGAPDRRGGGLPAPDHAGSGGKGLVEHRRDRPLSWREEDIAGTERQAVGFSNRGVDDDTGGEIQVGDELADEDRLLKILLAEVGHVRLDGGEQLGDDRGDAGKMVRADRALPSVGQTGQMDLRLESLGIHRLDRGRIDEIDAFLAAKAEIAGEWARVARVVFPGPELGRVHEDADDDGVAGEPRRANQGAVSGVEGPHGWHEAEDDAFPVKASTPCGHAGRVSYDPHAGI